MERFAAGAARLGHLASALLGWRPNEFWDSTPAELALAIAPPGEADGGLDRETIETLMKIFPDEESDRRNG